VPFKPAEWAAELGRTAASPRPYRNAAVSFRDPAAGSAAERLRLAEEGGWNVFRFPAAMIPGCDLLTDSGTTTMTMRQWSQLLLGDESYGSNEGYFDFKRQVVETFGPGYENRGEHENTFIFHQGRAAEHGLFTCLGRVLGSRGRSDGQGRPYYVIPSNGHFDTTQANLEDNRFEARNLFSAAARAKDPAAKFKGDMDTEALEALLAAPQDRGRVPLVYLTVTNNTGGGQPVSLANIRQVSSICRANCIPLMLDACRFAENAWFIKQHESACRSMTVTEIVHAMFEAADGFHISLKKDGLGNIGGALVVREDGELVRRYPDLPGLLTGHQVLVEGHPTYGGLAGRDLKALVEGLKTVVRDDYLLYRIGQVGRFGAAVDRACGADVTVKPFGGHAIYIDLDKFFAGSRLGDGDLPGIALTGLLLLAGHRLCELGIYAFGKQVDGREVGPDPRVNNVRAAVPRLCYEDVDLAALAETVGGLYRRRDRMPAARVEFGADLPMRHFISRFRLEEV
jgi:tryptophanase